MTPAIFYPQYPSNVTNYLFPHLSEANIIFPIPLGILSIKEPSNIRLFDRKNIPYNLCLDSSDFTKQIYLLFL
jgi:hypothetical protein